MTRETKIGLLVGLAFIIVIGILLSDHFTTATQPHQAALTTTIDDVLGSTRTLGPRRQNPAPLDVPAVEPRGPILVQPDPSLERRQHVDVGPANRGQRIIDVTEQPVIPMEPPITQLPDVRNGAGGAEENILAHTEPVVIAPEPLTNTNSSNTSSNTAGAKENVKTYTAEAGDTLGKIASKTMGKNAQANRDAIVKANPKLAENPNKVVIGESYNIPVQTPVASATKPEQKEPAKEVAPAAAANSVEYVVKDGDNLHKIAREQCGSSSFVSQIQEMNKDLLKGSDKLKINMKLRLPPKAVASR
ncbi:MAG TPA: LysM peptidoglycan-binding domain-containing protein [Tepidisphaeraceae bacterium]|jgi:nucleoid-associated protein YgaU|nr:LysM peptidoglycan-binding domain-containing protein [Tepidisphaeraceae bacterium]